MKAEELRIGNLVYCKTTCSITHILKEFVGIKTDDEFIQIEHIEPIPLTEEWLLKFGAKKIDGNEFEYSRFTIGERADYWWVTDDEYKYLTVIQYVHQFQNFVFIMDGNELTIKL